MAMYPAYTYAQVLDEYAITFYTLLAEGYRVRNKDYEMLAVIAEMPGAGSEIRTQFHKNLEYASMHPDDILKPSSKDTDSAQIKKILGG